MTVPYELRTQLLHARLASDPDADLSSLRTETDTSIGIGREVWRLRWRGQVTTAVDRTASLHVTCGALLDALALHLLATDGSSQEYESALLDISAVNVLVDRPLPGAEPTECDQAIRSVRDAVTGVAAHVWYACDDNGWIEDTAPAPTWNDDPRVADWVGRLLIPRLTSQPPALLLALVEAVDDPSLHLYPAATSPATVDRWSLRVDGLQIGRARGNAVELSVGQARRGHDSPQRTAFRNAMGADLVLVEGDSGDPGGSWTVEQAASRIRELLHLLRDSDVRGAPITHRVRGDVRIVDEHALEARLLKGLVTFPHDADLIADGPAAARGSQFPTMWARGDGHWDPPARYLDALLRRGSTPLAVELKVATGGQGRYFRRSIVQAVLYRHFIERAPGLDSWFKEAGLRRSEISAAVGVPIPVRWTPRFQRDLALLRKTAACVGVEVALLDERQSPGVEFPGSSDGSRAVAEPDEDTIERLSWRLVGELTRLYPVAFARVVEAPGGDGQYRELRLIGRSDGPSGSAERPQVSLNRPGSAWIWNQLGDPRWVWGGIWTYLAEGGELTDAARRIGVMAGLGRGSHPDPAPTFGVLAAEALESAPPGCRWCSACPSWSYPSWLRDDDRRFSRYARIATGDRFPTAVRLWALVEPDGRARRIVDQISLRTWES